MEILEQILDYLSQDPLRVLTVIGGSGGLAYWVSLYRNRCRIAVRVLHEKEWGSSQGPTIDLDVEIVNLGSAVIALKPEIALTGYTPKRRVRRCRFIVTGSDRGLQPHQPKALTATARVDDSFQFLWFKKYTFTVTRGRGKTIRFRCAGSAPLGRLRFFVEYLAFRLLRRTFNSKSRELNLNAP